MRLPQRVLLLFLEREAQFAQQRPAFVVVGGRGHNGDVHAAGPIDLVHVDFVEHGLLGQAEGVVAVAIELLVGQASEVTNTGQGHGQQPVQEFPHAVAAQGHAGTDGHAFTKLEVSNGLLGAPQFGLLAGNQG